jgi:predicted phosphate transport protein (TIGR00153 family)
LVEKGFLGLFEKRRRSKTLNLLQQLITQAISTVSELERALVAFSIGNSIESEACIQKLFSEEAEIDDSRREVLAELTRGELPAKYREDLKGLVEHLDKMADYVKDSARSIKVLTGSKIPSELLEEYISIAKDFRECATALGECIEMLGVDPLKAIELAKKVDVIEGRVDDGYLKAKSLLIKYSKELNTAILLEIKDLANFMEQATDKCINAADHVRVLAEAEVANDT